MNEKVENALNEARILVLIVQVMIGFQYQSVFQPGFDRLSGAAQHLKLSGLGLMLLALLLAMSPVAYHRIVESGVLSQRFQQFITQVLKIALLPFALALGIEFFVVGEKLINRSIGILCGCLASLTALFFWYGLEYMLVTEEQFAKEEKREEKMEKNWSASLEPTPLKERIRLVLTEERVILPGAQALLGFQFSAVFTDSFERLTSLARSAHFVSLSCVALATILLMAPAAFHRIVERGENTERLHSFASSLLLGSMAFLALGIAGDVFVVVDKVEHAPGWAWTAGGLTLLCCYGTWFVYMLYRRATNSPPVRPSISSSV
jgi:hypothetical protein